MVSAWGRGFLALTIAERSRAAAGSLNQYLGFPFGVRKGQAVLGIGWCVADKCGLGAWDP